MSTRTIMMAATVAFALPLVALPAFAQGGSGADVGTGQGGVYRMDHAAHPEGGEHTSMPGMPAKKKAMHMASHSGTHKAAYHGHATEENTTAALNAASLQAAQQNQPFSPTPPPGGLSNPPPGAAGAPAAKKAM